MLPIAESPWPHLAIRGDQQAIEAGEKLGDGVVKQVGMGSEWEVHGEGMQSKRDARRKDMESDEE